MCGSFGWKYAFTCKRFYWAIISFGKSEQQQTWKKAKQTFRRAQYAEHFDMPNNAILVWQGKMSGCWYANYFLLNCTANTKKRARALARTHTNTPRNKISNIVNAKFICIIKRVRNCPRCVWLDFFSRRFCLFACFLFIALCAYPDVLYICFHCSEFPIHQLNGKNWFWIWSWCRIQNRGEKVIDALFPAIRIWLCHYFISFSTCIKRVEEFNSWIQFDCLTINGMNNKKLIAPRTHYTKRWL